jgi:DNA-binding transcriptional ArsR family regulator
MDEAADLAKLGAVLSDPTRTTMVLSLMDGDSRAAGELQMLANVSPASTSAHLAKLVDARILGVRKEGRHKYYRITTAAVAHAVEALQIVASPRAAVQQIARSPINPFSFARTCYDHLAGRLGVEITAALRGLEIIRPENRHYEVTERGRLWLKELGIDCDKLAGQRRAFAIPCIDFTERRYHIAGTLGAALLERMIELNWIARARMPRSVRLTQSGRAELGRGLRLEFTDGQRVRFKPR